MPLFSADGETDTFEAADAAGVTEGVGDADMVLFDPIPMLPFIGIHDGDGVGGEAEGLWVMSVSLLAVEFDSGGEAEGLGVMRVWLLAVELDSGVAVEDGVGVNDGDDVGDDVGVGDVDASITASPYRAARKQVISSVRKLGSSRADVDHGPSTTAMTSRASSPNPLPRTTAFPPPLVSKSVIAAVTAVTPSTRGAPCKSAAVVDITDCPRIVTLTSSVGHSSPTSTIACVPAADNPVNVDSSP